MKCTSPPELDDPTLLAYLEGEANRQAIEHLSICPYCQARAEKLKRSQLELQARLFRADCPSSMELGEFESGLLEAGRAEYIRLHVQTCPHCTAELEQLREFLGATAAPEPVRRTSTIKTVLARLLGGDQPDQTGPVALAGAMAGLRGEAASLLRFEAGDVRVALEIQADPHHPDAYTLLGLLTGSKESLEVQVFTEKGLVAITPANESGNFVVENLAEGRYTILIRSEGQEIHLPELDVQS